MTKQVLKTADLGKGWSGTRYTDDSALVQNSTQGERIDLSPSSVATLRNAFNAAKK